MKSNKRKNRCIIISIIAVIFVVIIGCTLKFEISGFGNDDHSVAILVEDGDTVKNITRQLEDNGVIGNKLLFKVYLKIKGADSHIKTGNHYFSENMAYSDVVAELSRDSSVDGIFVTIPEGYEFRMIADLLQEKGLIDREKFYSLAETYDFNYDFVENIPERSTRLEGYLFPDTYYITSEEDELDILLMMLNRFDESFTDKMKKRAEELGMTVDEVVNLASIIQREAANSEEMPLVSSVFHNRLKSDEYPFLQSCATVQYILEERKPVLLNEDTEIDSPYNTYMYEGLPIGPIASPGIDALSAALYPADTDYYFFYADENGQSVFSQTFDQHSSGTYKGE